MKVVLIPCRATEWDDQGRLLGRVELPPTEAAQERAERWAEGLAPLKLQRILHAPDALTSRLAVTLARQLAVPTKSLEDLHEVDIGLWAGLTEAELKTRYSSAHRELCDAPLNVSPPGGESLSAASKRLTTCINKQIRKNGKFAIGLVMRPFSFAMTSCALGASNVSQLWETARHADEPLVLDVAEPVTTSDVG